MTEGRFCTRKRSQRQINHRQYVRKSKSKGKRNKKQEYRLATKENGSAHTHFVRILTNISPRRNFTERESARARAREQKSERNGFNPF